MNATAAPRANKPTCDPKRVQKTLAYPTLWNQMASVHRPMPNVKKAVSAGSTIRRTTASTIQMRLMWSWGMSPFEPTDRGPRGRPDQLRKSP